MSFCFSVSLSDSNACCFRGNWGVDLQAGSQYGYRLLFVVLLAGIFAVFLQVRKFWFAPLIDCNKKAFQVLASRLGCVTGLGEFLP